MCKVIGQGTRSFFLRIEFGSCAAAFRAMAEEVPTCDKGTFVGKERRSSCLSDEIDGDFSDMDESYSLDSGDE